MRNKIVVLLIVGITVAAGISSYIAQGSLARALEDGPFVLQIEAKALPLNTETTSQKTVGALTYAGGWTLSSENDNFGGWSGMVLDKEAHALIAISDKGFWLTTDFDVNAPTVFSKALLYPFEKGASKGMFAKIERDAESLVRTQSGFLIGLEQDHRILAVDAVGSASRRASYDGQVDLSVLSPNGGIEAMAKLADDRLIMFAEHGLDVNGTLPAWITGPNGAVERRFATPHNYSPTDAAALPNGDVLLLTRYYSALDGVAAKVLLISAAEIASGESLKGRELAHLAPPLSVDNMEALDVAVQPDGSVRLYLMSDDNFSPLQRTLFMVFDWKP